MSNSIAGPQGFLSLTFADKVITRSLQSSINKANTVNPSTRTYFNRYASYAIDLLESRLDATEKTWFPVLSKHDKELGERVTAYNHLRDVSRAARESLSTKNDPSQGNLADEVPKALGNLWREVESVFTVEAALLEKVEPKVSIEDMSRLEEEDKRRRLALMKKDGHLWCATYLMRSLTVEEREHFPPGVPGMAKSTMLMAGNWKFSREFQFAPDI